MEFELLKDQPDEILESGIMIFRREDQARETSRTWLISHTDVHPRVDTDDLYLFSLKFSSLFYSTDLEQEMPFKHCQEGGRKILSVRAFSHTNSRFLQDPKFRLYTYRSVGEGWGVAYKIHRTPKLSVPEIARLVGFVDEQMRQVFLREYL